MRSHSALQISQCNEIWIRNGKRVNPGRRHIKRGGDFFIDSLATCLVSPSTVIIKGDFFRSSGGFDEAMAACEDYDLWLRILAQSEIGLTEEPLAIRRAGHPDQLSATVPALDRFRVVTMLKLIAGFELAPVKRAAVCAVLASKCEILARGFARRGNLEAASLTEEIGRYARGCRGKQNTLEIGPILVKARSQLLAPMNRGMEPDSIAQVDA